jgi:uncharacterized membrane protein YcaP (DUF421 family)
MELWMNLLFGNPIGLASMIVIIATFLIVVIMFSWFIKKSKEEPDS